MVPAHLDDPPPSAGRRDAERVAGALDDEDRDLHGLELLEPARPLRARAAARRPEREREAENADGIRLGRRSAGDAGTRRAATAEQRQAGELVRAEMVDDGDPRGVELLRGRGRAAAGDTVRLFDEPDGDVLLDRRLRRRDEVGRADASTRTVPASTLRMRQEVLPS